MSNMSDKSRSASGRKSQPHTNMSNISHKSRSASGRKSQPHTNMSNMSHKSRSASGGKSQPQPNANIQHTQSSSRSIKNAIYAIHTTSHSVQGLYCLKVILPTHRGEELS